MVLSLLDWIIILGFLGLTLGIGLYYRNEAGKNLTSFFLGGRNMPWYIAGISMVATTFAADTPLAVSELVAQGGIAKNWLWWSFMFGGALTTFFFASFWRKANILTELEFIQLRYEGKAARYLRIFKAGYLGLFINAIIIAWVNLAMQSLLEIFFGLTSQEALWLTYGMMALALTYSALSGLKGVAITDAFQFSIAMLGCIILAYLVIDSKEVGGIAELKAQLPASALEFVPSLTSSSIESLDGMDVLKGFSLSIGAFLAFVAVQWWASWYPGAEPGGGGYIAQRMMSVRTPEESVWATLLFQVGHYCIRPWPWIIVGLCAILLYTPDSKLSEHIQKHQQPFALEQAIESPELQHIARTGITNKADYFLIFPEHKTEPIQSKITYHFEPRMGFVMAMRDFLPNGLRGLLLVAFIAAYMSTISTQINWGASYAVNDLWIPIKGEMSDGALVKVSRIASLVIMLLGALITPFITSIIGVWEFILQCGAGLGLVLILRWYWWRINAWSEIAATIAPLVAYLVGQLILKDWIGPAYDEEYIGYFIIVGFTTIVWVIVTFITPAPSENHIKDFMQRIEPLGIWPDISAQQSMKNEELKWMALNWLSMVVFIIGMLFGIGKLLLLEFNTAIIYLALALISALGLRMFLKKTNIFGRI